MKGENEMNMIASTTIIRGKGQCEAYMNNVVMKEMKRQNDRHAAEMAVMTKSRNGLLADRLEAYKPEQKESLWHRIKEKLEIAWCVFFGMLLELHLIEEVEDEQDE